MTRELLEEPTAANLTMSVDVRSLNLTDERFYQLCRDNEDLRLELTASGELIIMPGTGSLTGRRGARITYQLVRWTDQNGIGVAFDSSTMFTLPNGAKRSPDASWLRLDRWNKLKIEQQEGFAPICPDFVIELRSPSDSMATLQDKMTEYLENGSLLGWLLDPNSKSVYIYRAGQPVERLENPETVSGEPVLPGFVMRTTEIW
jgi:Uma2 family endonuclease